MTPRYGNIRSCYRVTLVAIAQLVEQLTRTVETQIRILLATFWNDSIRWSSGRILRSVLTYLSINISTRIHAHSPRSRSTPTAHSPCSQSPRVCLLLCDLGLGIYLRKHARSLGCAWWFSTLGLYSYNMYFNRPDG